MGILSVANTSLIWWGQGLGYEAEDEAEVEASLAVFTETSSSSTGLDTSSGCKREYLEDHRLLATCESGPPLEVRVPELETVRWDRLEEIGSGESLSHRRGSHAWWKRWTLPRVQEVELVLFGLHVMLTV